ncbi:AFG1-like ATPase [Saccoglossus kowalevskii]
MAADLGMCADAANSSVFTGEEEVFAFERTVSRLVEMQTAEYWERGTMEEEEEDEEKTSDLQ